MNKACWVLYTIICNESSNCIAEVVFSEIKYLQIHEMADFRGQRGEFVK